ncbi:16S rRNA (guanine(966)-N(2))-methyltransferase RsmD [Bacillus niameyensis]|uniref:16S rRNA (guanine(966)-N(2))-methyltransferase RsmD n=1 Tax=Bacillus niameyensis TaxID=1522308 RepID=UPI000781C2D8|nr:16S rRNA (guanine(966)-N(2))-methyltransferase RsmD [Bacillus niameyensis]
MRVISGIYKGRQLKAVPGRGTRPTTDKVKETIFNMIGPFFSEGTVLDLFAGSGALGIEALSRGIDKGIFVDKDMKAIQTIKTNIQLCNLDDKSEIYRNDAERALHAISKRNIQFDYIFLDPPYHKQKLESLLEQIEMNQLLKPEGAIVCEHDSNVVLPIQIGCLEQWKQGDYGATGLSIYKLKGIEKGDTP